MLSHNNKWVEKVESWEWDYTLYWAKVGRKPLPLFLLACNLCNAQESNLFMTWLLMSTHAHTYLEHQCLSSTSKV